MATTWSCLSLAVVAACVCACFGLDDSSSVQRPSLVKAGAAATQPAMGEGSSPLQNVIVVLKNASYLPNLKAICEEAADSSSGCGLGGICQRYYSASITGTAGAMNSQHLGTLHKCMPPGAISYVEQDGGVRKTEPNAKEYANWWQWRPTITQHGGNSSSNASSNSSSSAPSAGLRDAPGDVQALDGPAASAATSTADTGEQQQQRTAHERSQLAQLGLAAQQQLAKQPVPIVRAFDADTNDVYVNPSDVADPGISFPAAGMDVHSADLPTDIDLPGTKVQTLPMALWNLDSLDQRALPLNHEYIMGTASVIGTGKGVTIYTVDSGIMPLHQEFESWDGSGSRASYGPDYVNGDANSEDCDGHGTHVASTAVGRAVGVAKDAHVVAVRVLDCDGSGTISDVVAALDWVAQNAVKPAIVTLSLGVAVGSWSQSMEDSVRSLVTNYNITAVVASGNSATDSCNTSPARVPEAISVAASNLPSKFTDAGPSAGTNRTLYKWSNTGACTQIIAPGVDIYGACGGTSRCESVTPTAYTWASGTSMAVPHVAGVAALWLEDHPSATPAQVKQALVAASTPNCVDSAGMLPGTPNALLFSGVYTTGLPAAVVAPPSAAPVTAQDAAGLPAQVHASSGA